jgi:hypothetical protein
VRPFPPRFEREAIMMGLTNFLDDLRGLHGKVTEGTASVEEQQSYQKGREDLALAILLAEKMQLKQKERARRSLRTPHECPVELRAGSSAAMGETIELSAFGFSMVLDTTAPEWRGPVAFRISLPKGGDVSGEARMAGKNPPATRSREGFAITEISDAGREALANVVFEDLLSELRL